MRFPKHRDSIHQNEVLFARLSARHHMTGIPYGFDPKSVGSVPLLSTVARQEDRSSDSLDLLPQAHQAILVGKSAGPCSAEHGSCLDHRKAVRRSSHYRERRALSLAFLSNLLLAHRGTSGQCSSSHILRKAFPDLIMSSRTFRQNLKGNVNIPGRMSYADGRCQRLRSRSGQTEHATYGATTIDAS